MTTAAGVELPSRQEILFNEAILPSAISARKILEIRLSLFSADRYFRFVI